MNRRLLILTLIIIAALCSLTLLGYHAIARWAEGLEWKRLGEFAEVAEQIRQDVKRKLDDFIRREEQRPYTHYQYYYVPESPTNAQQQMALLRSPLAGRMENDLAYGYFQIDPDGRVTSLNEDIIQFEGPSTVNARLNEMALSNSLNVRRNLLPVLSGSIDKALRTASRKAGPQPPGGRPPQEPAQRPSREYLGSKVKYFRRRRDNYPIASLQNADRGAQVVRQSRETVVTNVAVSEGGPAWVDAEQVQQAQTWPPGAGEPQSRAAEETQTIEPGAVDRRPPLQPAPARQIAGPSKQAQPPPQPTAQALDLAANIQQQEPADTVLVRMEPFVPIVVRNDRATDSIFGGQVFLLRHVQIENRHIRQGFLLNEKRLIQEVRDSAARFMREGMRFALPQLRQPAAEHSEPAYTAVLDFGFGELVLNLDESDPAALSRQIDQLRNWYFSIVTVVCIATGLGLVSLWRYARAQARLAEKKDDFISAVSHELRTPLTSIRMYSEMLEKGWVKSEQKLLEYYRSMRQETERLSRLIENVLDFSRIQKGRKKYNFTVGDLNRAVLEVVEMMRPYAGQHNFVIETQLEPITPTAFDRDCVKQIVVNLLDNAVKYARNARDRTITVRTSSDDGFAIIEVEDHGPGVPRRQRKKIFEQFYRTEAEATRETAGTGLGLALVKKFVEAHNGFVEILTAEPAGAIFRVALPVRA